MSETTAPVKPVEKMNIFEKMSAVAAEVGWVSKNLSITTKQNSYKAVCEADILAAVKPVEAKYHIYSYPETRAIFDQSEWNDKFDTKHRYARIVTVYTFLNMDKTDEKISMTSYGEALDTGDKGLGKAMTYCDKYALMKAYKIQTGDDPDAEASPEDKASTKDGQKEIADGIKAVQSARRACSDAGVDVHEGSIQEWLASHAEVQNIDPTACTLDEMKRVVAAYNTLTKNKLEGKSKNTAKAKAEQSLGINDTAATF